MILRGAILSIVLLLPALGQFANLATTDDGSQLYFSSTLRLRGTNEAPYRKIFRFDGSTFQLFAQAQDTGTAPPPGNASNYFDLGFPSVSGDGSVVSYYGEGLTTVQFSDNRSPVTFPYRGQLSRNGKYALGIGSERALSATVYRVDLSNGAATLLSGATFVSSSQAITSNGRAVFVSSLAGQITLWSASGSQVFTVPSPTEPYLIVSDDGSWIVGASGNLYSINVATGQRTTILRAPAVNGVSYGIYSVSMSSDGSLVLAVVPQPGSPSIAQAVIVRPDGTGYRQLTSEETGIVGATLSGDGKVAYAVTGDGSLLKIAVDTGASQVLIASQPVVNQVQGAPVPGSLNLIQGQGLSNVTVTSRQSPLPSQLGDVQVTLNGVPAPMLSVSSNGIRYQIPWETPLGNVSLQVVRGQTPFEQTTQLPMQTAMPADALGAPIHQDFSALVDPFHPAQPGEIVSFYLTGLGAVSPSAVDGTAGPTSPLAVVANPVVVLQAGGASQPPGEVLDVLYQGLAPGLVGIYQMNVRLPAHVFRNPLLPNGGPVSVSLAIQYSGGQSITLAPVWMTPNQS